MSISKDLKVIYELLYKAFGPRNWWPADSPFEVAIGAILTQNTNWKNVEKAIANLKKANILSPEELHKIDIKNLAEHIKPAGYFNIKAKRIKNFMNWLFENYDGSLDQMFSEGLSSLRENLLSVNGIGAETADSILLYAGEMPTFVIDSYTCRILSRHEMLPDEGSYDDVKSLFEDNLPEDTQLYNDFHAQLVHLGNQFCKPKRKCEECPLNVLL